MPACDPLPPVCPPARSSHCPSLSFNWAFRFLPFYRPSPSPPTPADAAATTLSRSHTSIKRSRTQRQIFAKHLSARQTTALPPALHRRRRRLLPLPAQNPPPRKDSHTQTQRGDSSGLSLRTNCPPFTKPISHRHPVTSEFMSIENLKTYGTPSLWSPWLLPFALVSPPFVAAAGSARPPARPRPPLGSF